ncbi:hypothetical protein ABPG72_005394 [Tetrahymena utriculariae]
MEQQNQVYKFETFIKFIKKEKKKPFVDIWISYEVKNKDIGIDDYIDVNCVQIPQIQFRGSNVEKSIANIINFDLQDKNNRANLDEVIKHAKSQIAKERTLFVISFLDYVKLNIYNHAFSLQKQQKNLPDPDYKYYADNKFAEETKDQLNQIQSFINGKSNDPSIPKVCFYFLETPVCVNQKKMIKICVSDEKDKDLDDLNTPYIFNCNNLGCLQIPNRYKLNTTNGQEFDEMLQNLLPKHTIFVIRTISGEIKNLAEDDIVGGFYRLSPEFLQGFQKIVQYIATMSLA